jgi:hypothetical protein
MSIHVLPILATELRTVIYIADLCILFQRFAKELKLRRFSITLLQVGQEFLPLLLGACLPHDFAAVQRLALARRFLGFSVRQ